LEATQDGIWDLNLQSGHLFWSGRCFTMLGYAPGEFPMSLQRWREILHPEDQELVWPRLQDLLQGQVDPFEIEYRCHAKDETFRLIMCRGKPVQWAADDRVVRVVGTHVDITDRRRMEIQLQQSQKMEAIGTLAGGVAHDFNNILGIIIGNAELALHDMLERHPAATHMEEIKKAAMRAKDVVRQLLSFGRRTDQKKEPLKLQRIVDESLQFLRASIPSTIDIRSHAPSDLNVVAADPTQLHQVLINLCTNAAHAMESNGGVLEVRLANVDLGQNAFENGCELAPGRYVQLSVSDTGSGIDPKILDRVFDPFFTTKPDGKGTGIGLAVVHGIVKNHDGDISIESEPGRGTTVKVLLPVVDASPASMARRQKHLPTGNERILLIDDEKSLVKIGVLLLGRLGYTVIARTDPVEALTLFKTAPDKFDLVITDMTMPGMTGAQLSAAILKIRPDIPIILCSGFNEKIDSRSALDFGFRRCIEKPFNQQELATAVRKTLDGL
jgi:PAS domain S-box-containing protein